jgi:site-specific DNA recombinase
MTKRAVIYARVSTDEQTKGYSLPTQLEACRKYAAERGYEISAEFRDDHTGASLDRPGLNQLREFVAAASIEVMVVYDVDRLARKSVYQMLIEEEMNRQGVTVEYVNGQYADTDEGRLQKQIKASIAEYEKAKILERSKRGKRGKAQSGFVIVGARPPYGYRVVSEPHKAWLEIDEEEARIVRLVFELYTSGDPPGQRMSIVGIAKRLANLRIPTRGDKCGHVAKKHGPTVWTAAMIRHILTNETYTGVWHYGKTQMISDGKDSTRKAKRKRGLGKQIARPREEWVAVEVPPIINRETFEWAKGRLEDNKRLLNGRPNKNRFLLSKRLTCSKCGYGIHCQCVRGKHHYYICNGRYQIVSLCDMPSFRGDLLDEIVWQWVKGLMQHPDQLAEGLRGEQAESERAHSALRERLTIIEARLADTQTQLDKLLDLYLNGDFPKEFLTERKARLEKDVADLTRERKELAAHLQAAIITDAQIAEIETYCAEVREGLDNATFEDKRRYFELLKVRGKLAVENEEKVVYASCRIGQQRLSQVQTSPSSNTGVIEITLYACLRLPRSP